MNSPLISVIIPVYKAEKFIADCLESVINQTYTNLEIIIINEGAVDKSGEICDSYAVRDTRISVFHQKKSGVSVARNVGIGLAHGEFIQFVDADDVIMPNMCEKLITALLSTNCDTVICGFKTIFFNNEDIVRVIDIVPEPGILSCEKNMVTRFCLLREKGLMNVSWNKLYRRSVLHKNNIIFPVSIPISEDQFFALRYWEFVRSVCVISDTLYVYRQINGISITSKYHPDYYNYCLRFSHAVNEFCRKHAESSAASECVAVARIALKNACTAIEYLVHHADKMTFAVLTDKIRAVMHDPLVTESLHTQTGMTSFYMIMKCFIRFSLIYTCIGFIKTRRTAKRLQSRFFLVNTEMKKNAT